MDWHASRQQDRRVRMPQVMQPDRRHLDAGRDGAGDRLASEPREPLRVPVLAFEVTEDQGVIADQR